MRNSTYLFHLNTFNDTDHMAPVIFYFLKNKETVEVIYLSDYNFKCDYRIKWFKKYPNFSVNKASKSQILVKKLFNNRTSRVIRSFFPVSFNRYLAYLTNPQLRNVACVFYEWGDAYKLNFLEAKYLEIPTICLPHGYSIFKNHDVNTPISEHKKNTGKWPDFSERNAFDAFIVQTKRHRNMLIEMGHDHKKIFSWGSARFDPKWSMLNRSIQEKFNPKIKKDFIKVVFFLPHWSYNVDIEETIKCLKEIVTDKEVFLVVKGHTRGSGSLNDEQINELKNNKNVVLNSTVNSSVLINWSDIVINFGSSIAIEALIQKRLIIHPYFLHSNRTIFDDGTIVKLASNIQKLKAIIDDFKTSKTHVPHNKNSRVFMKREVFNDKVEFDVPGFYYKEIKKMGVRKKLEKN